MVNIRPFEGIRYNKEVILDLNEVVTPPYDKISDSLQDTLYARSPYNFVRLDKGREDNKYELANKTLETWLSNGVLIKDSKPSIYLYNQEYSFNGLQKTRRGFIALLKLDEFKNGNVNPHEHTLSGPKKDRLELIKATQATFGQIFMLYRDKDNAIMQSLRPFEDAKDADIAVFDDDKNKHSVWRVYDMEAIVKIQELMKTKKVYIADGHHRYETSLKYKEMQSAKGSAGSADSRDALYNYVMCTFINMDDYEGMSILPTHRFVRNLDKFVVKDFLEGLGKNFRLTRFADIKELNSALNNAGSHCAFGIILEGGKSLYMASVISKEKIAKYFPNNYSEELKSLDVAILHNVILEGLLDIDAGKLSLQTNVDYYRDMNQGLEYLESGKYEIGFLLNATKLESLAVISEAGDKMPQKSTDFYPKLLSGLVVFSIKER